MYENKLVELQERMSKQGKASEFKEIFEDFIEACEAYIHCVDSMALKLSLAKEDYDRYAFQAIATELDRSRRNRHNILLGYAKIVNKLCSEYRCENVFDLPQDKQAHVMFYEIANTLVEESNLVRIAIESEPSHLFG